MDNRLPVTVVIATLGGVELTRTLECLFHGTRTPEEVLVCIPDSVTPAAVLPSRLGLRLIRTPCRGQVAQRAYGLALAASEFVVQMDDDVNLPETALEQLFAAINRAGPRSAVAPLFKQASTGDYLTRYRGGVKGVLKSLSATLIGGAPWGAGRMGRIDRSGIPYAVDREYCDGRALVETEWVPGGCVICRREDLILDNYFPFPGKAFSEDVIHSLIWRKRGVRLWVAPDIACATHVVAMPSTAAGIRADYRARAHVVALNGGSLFRCRLWFALYAMRQLFSRFRARKT